MAYDRKQNHDLTTLRPGKDKPKSEQTFEERITSTFTTVREDVQRTARETNTYNDKIIGLLEQLEQSHLRTQVGQTTNSKENVCKEKFDCLLSANAFLLSELAPCRTQVVQAGEEATEAQLIRMKRSRKEIMNAAKRRLDEGREKQQLAADASELMKHYKALITAS
ncbi:hypothetical protein JVU11DRAFT_712 [Chiua virens]|nr:hypothetical protein JVU11DRAFT_712 [Chiua virens]